jgi:phi13 family phage major tail protein
MKAKVNKYKAGLKNVKIAPIDDIDLTKADGEAYTYGDIFAVPGAQSISLSSQYTNSSIAADDDPDYVNEGMNAGYDGSLQVVNLPVEFEKYILCRKNGIENADTVPKDFAMICEFTGDKSRARRVMFHCVLTKLPDITHNTKDNNLSVDNDTLNIKVIKRKDTGDITGKAFEGWSVYEKMLTEIPKPSDFAEPTDEEDG